MSQVSILIYQQTIANLDIDSAGSNALWNAGDMREGLAFAGYAIRTRDGRFLDRLAVISKDNIAR